MTKHQTDKGPTAFEDSPETVTRGPVNNGLGRTGRDLDFLYVAEGQEGFSGDRRGLVWDSARNALLLSNVAALESVVSFTSEVIDCQFPAREFLPSWNIKYGGGVGFRVYVRLFDAEKHDSPWFFLGEGGPWGKQDDEVCSDEEWGRVRIDYLELTRDAAAFQYRIEFLTPDPEAVKADDVAAEIHRFYLAYSGLDEEVSAVKSVYKPESEIRVSVPYRSQLDVERKDIAHVVCCPTCIAMVLDSLGVNCPTLDVCDLAYCERYKIYGIWPRASQVAFECGVKSWIQRFRTMDQVAEKLRDGRPIIASIRVKQGDLRGARYPESSGHLLVITGLTTDGKVIVNDPYSPGPEGQEIQYFVEDIEKCWLDCGGVAVMLDRLAD